MWDECTGMCVRFFAVLVSVWYIVVCTYNTYRNLVLMRSEEGGTKKYWRCAAKERCEGCQRV